MNTHNLSVIIKREYITELKSKSFWLGTILMPIILIGFGAVMGYFLNDSEITRQMANPGPGDVEHMTDLQAAGMLVGILLTLFLMINGASIYNRVKIEKTNRIVEILATCVEGRVMMLAKVIAVGLIGLTQILIWGLIVGILGAGLIIVFQPDISFEFLSSPTFYLSILWGVLFFIGGYVFYGALYAGAGALTVKDNENQAFMTVLTFLLLGSFYIGEYAATNPDSPMVIFLCYFPFTSPTIGAVQAISQQSPIWQTILMIIVLYGFAILSFIFSGKIYTSTILMQGKKLTPKDIIVFLKAK